MPRKRAEKPSWFKLFGMHRPLMEVMPAEALGEAMKAVMTYFATGELTELTDPYAIALFAAVKPQVDDAYEDLRRSIECGRAGGLKAKEMYAAGTGGVYPPTAPVTEGEGEREEEGEGEGDQGPPIRVLSPSGSSRGQSGLDKLARLYQEEFSS